MFFNNRKKTLTKSEKTQRFALIFCFVMVGVFVFLFEMQRIPEQNANEIRIHYIDVGQGNSVLVHSNNNAVLIDAGVVAASSAVVAYIERLGITTLDYVVATHPHSDHIGGLPAVLDNFEVRELWMPDVVHDTNTFERLLDAVERNGVEITTIMAGDTLSAGIIQMTAVAPNSNMYSNLNDYSIVLHMSFGYTGFLFTGDAEALSENEMLAAGHFLQADILQVAHHGSATSTTEAFLDAVMPFAAVIQSGAENQFGHPHPSVISRLEERGIVILRNDEMGTIVLATDGLDIHLYD
ncbi:MAG: MBL fold metallo-hydrolase [Turicibacter sp.]|nr:MBL fold metallo-hydrolase [Turicibacter sp.]